MPGASSLFGGSFFYKSDSKEQFWATLRRLSLFVSALLTLREESWESVTCVTHPKAPPPSPPLTSVSQCSVSIEIERPCPWSRASRPLSLATVTFWQKKNTFTLSINFRFFQYDASDWLICLSIILRGWGWSCGAHRRTGESAVHSKPQPQPVIWADRFSYNNYIKLISYFTVWKLANLYGQLYNPYI